MLPAADIFFRPQPVAVPQASAVPAKVGKGAPPAAKAAAAAGAEGSMGVKSSPTMVPAPAGSKRCAYPGCKRPEQGKRFYQIQGTSSAGGQDWKPLSGSVLCHMCYTQYTKKGTLQRTVHRGEPLTAEQKRCSYAGCKKPESSWKFIKIDGSSKAGQKDWSALNNKIICGTCYDQFKRTGTLERAFRRGDPLDNAAKRCTYAHCKRPDASSTFYQIHGSSNAGGKNWKALDGSILCESCYDQYRKRGTLERTVHRQETSSLPAAPAPPPVAAVPAPAAVSAPTAVPAPAAATATTVAVAVAPTPAAAAK
jgi:hypothetical protein